MSTARPAVPQEIEELLAIPYVMDVRSVQRADGDWMCRLSYDELPGCVAEGRTPFDALTRLELLRRRIVTQLVEQGHPVPQPRPALAI